MTLGSMSVALTFHPAPHYARILQRVNLLGLRIPLSRLPHRPNENALEVATVPHDVQLVRLHGLSQAFEDRVHLGFEGVSTRLETGDRLRNLGN
jgi:hypothetical protein